MNFFFEIIGLDREDYDDLINLVHLCFFIFHIISSFIIISVIVKDGGLPPEPEFWLEIERAIGI